MIDRTKLPDFLQDMPEERLKEIVELNKANFDNVMDRVICVQGTTAKHISKFITDLENL